MFFSFVVFIGDFLVCTRRTPCTKFELTKAAIKTYGYFVNNVDTVADKWQFKIDTLWILVSFMLKMFYHVGDSVIFSRCSQSI